MPDNKEFKLEPLPYAYDSLEPYIDKDTMILHHDKHHQAYVDNLNKILSTHPEIEYKNLEQLLSNPTILPRDVRQSILNNAGGVYNHNFFWSIMSPNKGGQAKDELLKAIEKDFGSFQSFKEKFNKSALSTFGSGWTWLVSNDEGELAIMSTSNQDSPITSGIKPIIAIDLWEHSYYLKYKNERNKYIENWWNVVNWEQANKNYLSK
ncbi:MULTISPECIES: superoxide dismutase [Paraclostridium]|uniref:superoxide dismutase n=1 Tax=Paraclostridium dentum TaxID=2662455 RepID=UPI00051CF678|nr:MULTISPECIES: superoxide dismutase [Paraclostridium]KGJ48270.1 superoxide dismutase [Clostridium sp. NCR]MCU9812630.1 superoxide dismutase [Paraclostridium sp. AKS81]